MEGWIWKALCNEAPFRYGKNLASSGITIWSILQQSTCKDNFGSFFTLITNSSKISLSLVITNKGSCVIRLKRKVCVLVQRATPNSIFNWAQPLLYWRQKEMLHRNGWLNCYICKVLSIILFGSVSRNDILKIRFSLSCLRKIGRVHHLHGRPVALDTYVFAMKFRECLWKLFYKQEIITVL